MLDDNAVKKLIKQATLREALARTDARSDHSVLEFLSCPTVSVRRGLLSLFEKRK
jgi:hypothetical protein